MDYVRSNKGGMKLLFQNNLYVKQKVLSSGAVCWECDQHRNKFACKAKLHVLDDQDVLSGGFLSRVFLAKGVFVQGVLPGGLCPGGFCLGGFCLDT